MAEQGGPNQGLDAMVRRLKGLPPVEEVVVKEPVDPDPKPDPKKPEQEGQNFAEFKALLNGMAAKLEETQKSANAAIARLEQREQAQRALEDSIEALRAKQASHARLLEGRSADQIQVRVAALERAVDGMRSVVVSGQSAAAGIEALRRRLEEATGKLFAAQSFLSREMDGLRLAGTAAPAKESGENEGRFNALAGEFQKMKSIQDSLALDVFDLKRGLERMPELFAVSDGAALKRGVEDLSARISAAKAEWTEVFFKNQLQEERRRGKMEDDLKGEAVARDALAADVSDLKLRLDCLPDFKAVCGRLDEMEKDLKARVQDQALSAKKIEEFSLGMRSLEERMNILKYALSSVGHSLSRFTGPDAQPPKS